MGLGFFGHRKRAREGQEEKLEGSRCRRVQTPLGPGSGSLNMGFLDEPSFNLWVYLVPKVEPDFDLLNHLMVIQIGLRVNLIKVFQVE